MDREIGPIDLRKYALVDIEEIWGTAMHGQHFPDGITIDQKFRIAAAALALPTAEGMAEFYKKEGEEKFAWMTDRLVRVCELTCLVWEKAEAVSSGMGDEFTKSLPREIGTYGRYQLSCTANKYFEEVSATQTPAGWAIPRLLIALEDKHKIRVGEGNPVDNILTASLERHHGPVQMLGEIAEYMYKNEGFEASELLGFLLKSQILTDQSNPEMYYEVIDAMPGTCPGLWKEAERLYVDYGEFDQKVPGWMVILNLRKTDQHTRSISSRFRYASGETMNGFFMDSRLADAEKDLCNRLLDCGPLGMSSTKLGRLENEEKESLQKLFEEGVIWRLPLYDWARMYVEKESGRYAELGAEGGFLAADTTDKSLIRIYDRALKIVNEGRTLKNQKLQYQIMPTLYDFANIAWL